MFISYSQYKLNEKFTEDSDPISDMGIGKFEVGDTVKLKDNADINFKFSEEQIIIRIRCDGYIILQSGYAYPKETLDLVRKGSSRVNEKFIEDSDPISDMSIGTTQLEEILGIRLERENKKLIYTGKNLNLSHTEVTELPDNLVVYCSLYADHSKLTKLPDNLHIEGYLSIEYTGIKELPKNLYVGDILFINGTKITEIPKDAIIEMGVKR
jgi:hypothetical protein